MYECLVRDTKCGGYSDVVFMVLALVGCSLLTIAEGVVCAGRRSCLNAIELN